MGAATVRGQEDAAPQLLLMRRLAVEIAQSNERHWTGADKEVQTRIFTERETSDMKMVPEKF
jgi:hypothetical protein